MEKALTKKSLLLHQAILDSKLKTARNINEQQLIAAQAALKISEIKYKTLVESIPISVYVAALDKNCTNLYQSPNIQHILGISAKYYIQHPNFWMQRIHPEDKNKVLEARNNSRKNLVPLSIEYRMLHKNGKLVWVRDEATIINDNKGRPLFLQGFIENITECKNALENLQAIKNYNEQLIQATNTLIIGLDIHGKIILFNRAAEKLTGYTSKQVLNKSWMQTFIPKRWQSNIKKLHRTIVSGQKQQHFENPIRTKAGKERYILWQNDNLIKAGKIIGTLSFGVDITENKYKDELLRQKAEELDQFFENSLDLLCIASMDGYFLRLNKTWNKTLGYSLKDLQQQPFINFVHPDDKAATIQAMGKLRKQHKVLNFINRYRCKNGTYRWIEWNAYPQGEILYSVAHDVTASRKAEQELLLKNALLEGRSEATKDGILVVDSTNKIILHNRRFVEMWQIPNKIMATQDNKKLLQIMLPQLTTPASFLKHTVQLNKSNSSKNTDNIEFKDGRVFERYSAPLIDSMGNNRGRIWFFNDISEITKARTALQENEKKYRTIVNQTFELIGLISPDGILTEASQSAVKFVGAKKADVVGKPFWKTPWWTHSKAMQKKLRAAILQAKKGKPVSFEATHPRADGTIANIDFSLKPVFDDAGKVILLVPEGRDITEHKKAAAELEKYHNHLEELVKDRTMKLENAITSLEIAKRDAEAANRAKSVFLANMSHEIRTPLSAVLGYTQLLLRDPTLQDQQRDFINIINHSGSHLLALINDILEISKIEPGCISLNEEDFALPILLHNIETMCQARANEKQLSLKIIINPDVPTWIHADAGKIRQIIINLLGNAIKFTEKGEVTVHLSCQKTNPQTKLYQISVIVKDTGIGIAPNDLPTIFDAFKQISRNHLKEQGAGLGLTISKRYAQSLNGNITVESEAGKGSTFNFTFPAKMSLLSAADLENKTVMQTRKIIGLTEKKSAPKVLIVDDDAPSRDILRLFLTNIGFQVNQAINGKEAIAVAHTWNPDIILMDIIMPVMNGIEATRILKNTPTSKKIPIIIITASLFEEEFQKAAKVGADGFIRKPFIDTEIFEVIGKLLNLSYVYEKLPLATVTAPEIITPIAADTIPQQMVTEIIDAAESGDFTQLQKIFTTQIAPINYTLSNRLQRYLDNYDYDKIIQTLRSKKGEKQ